MMYASHTPVSNDNPHAPQLFLRACVLAVARDCGMDRREMFALRAWKVWYWLGFYYSKRSGVPLIRLCCKGRDSFSIEKTFKRPQP